MTEYNCITRYYYCIVENIHPASISDKFDFSRYSPYDIHPSSCYSPPKSIDESESYKIDGNNFFKENKYNEAYESYSKAIECCPWDFKYDNNRAYSRRAPCYESKDKLEEALNDYKMMIKLDPSRTELNYKIKTLEKQIEIKTEQMKTEMLGKLKDFGNTILGKFGLSLDNFKLNKDPNSGGYSVQFQR